MVSNKDRNTHCKAQTTKFTHSSDTCMLGTNTLEKNHVSTNLPKKSTFRLIKIRVELIISDKKIHRKSLFF